MPITKHNYIVKDVNQLADTIRRAFGIARRGRPGPVLIDIPKDVTANMAEYEPKKIVQPRRRECVDEVELQAAADMIQEAKKPYIFRITQGCWECTGRRRPTMESASVIF